MMPLSKKNKTESQVQCDTHTLLLYSVYLAIGSVAVFASLVALNTAYQGWIWSYSERYIINSLTLAFVLFLSGVLLILTCFRLIQKRRSARLFGFIGIGLLIAYSLFVLLIDRYIAYTLVYVVMLLVLLVFVLTGIAFLFRKKP